MNIPRTDAQANDDDPTGKEPLERRSFLKKLGAAGLTAGSARLPEAGAAVSRQTDDVSKSTAGAGASLTQPVHININGVQQKLDLDPRTTLLDALREHLHLTGTKKGCDHGQCGACTVHVNGRRVNACLSFAASHDGDEVTTIEGIGGAQALHPMQAAFVEHDGYQCGYCTSGQIMSAVALLKEPCGRRDADVKELMSGNICRCGAYQNIVAAIQQVRIKG
jgi:xanthine dehydrogenase YagT iron-sulfur-binding subunit